MSDQRTAEGWRERRDALRHKACCGNASALSLLSILMDTVETWDDLIDKDKPVEETDINRVFINLLFFLPQNEFFEKNKAYLMPVIMTCINAWLDSNAMQKSHLKHERMWAWALKQMGVELYGAMAFLTGGFAHMREIADEIRQLLAHEAFEDFEKEHGYA